jgi:hypothetical protein
MDTSAATLNVAAPELGESSLLDQLHDLHRKLAAVRQDSRRYSTNRNEGPIPMANESNKIIVCSVRRCVRMVKTNQDDSWQYIQSDTGLKSAIDYLSEGNNIKWISWPGAVVDESSQDGVRRKLEVIKLTRTFYDQKYDKGTNESCSQSIIAGQCFLIARP